MDIPKITTNPGSFLMPRRAQGLQVFLIHKDTLK
jgi:hypothetical protein